MKTYMVIIAVLACFTLSSAFYAYGQVQSGTPFVFELNYTAIKDGPSEFSTRGIERLEIYHLSILCDEDRIPMADELFSNDFVEFKYNKTFYHYFYPICVLDEENVCEEELETPYYYQGRTYLENEKFLMTNGRKIRVARGRKYFICEHNQHKVYTFYSREECLHDLDTNEEEYKTMTNAEKLDVDKRQYRMTSEYLTKKHEEIEQYRASLETTTTTTTSEPTTTTTETQTPPGIEPMSVFYWRCIAAYGVVTIVVVAWFIWGTIRVIKKQATENDIKYPIYESR